MKQVWILDEGSQGHVVQSRGLARELAKFVPLHLSEMRLPAAPCGKFIRSFAKRLLRLQRKMWLFKLYHPKMELPADRPELIISSGPNSLVALEFLSKYHACPSVFVQGTVHVPPGAVTCIMRPFEGDTRDDIIPIPLLFTEITPDAVLRAKQDYLTKTGRPKTAPLKALFIGQSSAKIQFEPEDWDDLIAFVNRSWKDDGIRWLISTSYRTGGMLENRLRDRIEKEAIHDAVWYSREPRKITKEFLGMADRVFVTMDSLTMVTESIASGLPVAVIRPRNHVCNLKDSHHRYIHGLRESGLVNLIDPGKNFPAASETTRPPVVDYGDAVRRMMLKIGWNP